MENPTFSQQTIDIDTGPAAQQALVDLFAASQLAVDAELDALHAFRPRLCFVQMATDERVYLFDTLRSEVPAQLFAELLCRPGTTKFFHAAQGDLSYLAQAGVRVQGLFDTHRAATLLGWPKVGLADLARDLLGVELAKEHQQADFSMRPLPPEMRRYIADDVRYLCEIGRRVEKACVEANILEEVQLDCIRMCDEAVAPKEASLLCPKVPRGQLPTDKLPLAMALAETLHQRRIVWAEAADVPLGRMLSNAAVIGIATQLPQTLQALSRVEGVRRPFVREHGEEVLVLVAQAIKQNEQGELRAQEASVRDPKRKKREDLLKAFRAEKAPERRVTSSVVLPNPLLQDLAAQPPATLEALAQFPYFGSKRFALYGTELLTLLQRAI